MKSKKWGYSVWSGVVSADARHPLLVETWESIEGVPVVVETDLNKVVGKVRAVWIDKQDYSLCATIEVDTTSALGAQVARNKTKWPYLGLNYDVKIDGKRLKGIRWTAVSLLADRGARERVFRINLDKINQREGLY